LEGIDERIAEVERDLEHGANFLTTEAVRVLGVAAEAYPPTDEWAFRLTKTAERLTDAKPSMAGLRNAVNRLLGQVLELGSTEGSRAARTLAERLLTELRDAAETAASNAAAHLPERAMVATGSYSSSVMRACLMARKLGKQVRVVVFEPLEEQKAPGHRLFHDLTGQGFETLLRGAVTGGSLEAVDVVLVGADAVTPGYVVNGSPSLVLARAAWGQVPLRVVCETVKFTSGVSLQPGYDRIPVDLVEVIVTEDGLQTPGDVRRRVKMGGLGLSGWQ